MKNSVSTRRHALTLALGAAATAAGWPAFASTYPEKPIRMVVASPAGGGPDLLARTLAEALRSANGWNVLVINQPGVGGHIGTAEVAKAAPDGYTVLFGHVGALAVNPTLFEQLPFDPLKDFAPAGMIATSPLVLVPVTTSAADFGRFLRTEITRWGKVVQDAGVEPQ